MNKPQMVSYTSYDEVLVFLLDMEKDKIKEWFEGTGRDLKEYDRKEHVDSIQIQSLLNAPDNFTII